MAEQTLAVALQGTSHFIPSRGHLSACADINDEIFILTWQYTALHLTLDLSSRPTLVWNKVRMTMVKLFTFSNTRLLNKHLCYNIV